MRTKTRAISISTCVLALLAGSSLAQAGTQATADARAVANLENSAVKADLAGDPAFYRKALAEDWTRGDSDGTWYTKGDIVGLMADKGKIQFNSEKISDLKVRTYGNAAVATYRSTYDILIMGHRRAHSIIATDTFAKVHGEWKQVSSHGAETK